MRQDIIHQHYGDTYEYYELRPLIISDMQDGNVKKPFDFFYNTLKDWQKDAPDIIKSIKDAHGFSSGHCYENDQDARCVELVATFHPYDQSPLVRYMTKHVLARPPLLDRVLDQYQRYIEDGYVPNKVKKLSDDPYVSEDLPFVDDVMNLLKNAEDGHISKTLERLIPLVNLLARHEANGFFPLGVGIDGMDMSNLRYKTAGEIFWKEDDADIGLRNAILFVVKANKNEFYNEDATKYAVYMLAIMADYKCTHGTGFWLPDDLQWLMVCEEREKQDLPIETRYESHPAVPWDYNPEQYAIHMP